MKGIWPVNTCSILWAAQPNLHQLEKRTVSYGSVRMCKFRFYYCDDTGLNMVLHVHFIVYYLDLIN